jgi:hypothetical protein
MCILVALFNRGEAGLAAREGRAIELSTKPRVHPSHRLKEQL